MNTESRAISRDFLGELLQTAGVPLPDGPLDQLWRFHGFLRQQNPRLNLTRIFNFHNMVRKHYVDSLLVEKIFRERGLEWPDLTLDLGTGPGFPGIPLAILRPDRRFILAEGRHQRVEFLKQAVERLGLENTEVFGGRIHAGKGQQADAVITRAVELMPATIERMLPFVPAGGLFIFMKGPHCDQEIADGRIAYQNWLELALDEAYTLPDSRDDRRLVVWRRKKTAGAEPPVSVIAAAKSRAPDPIRSHDNDRFKRIKSLHASRGIKKQNRALVSGLRLANDYLEKSPEICRELIIEEDWPADDERGEDTLRLLKTRADLDLPLRVFQRDLFRELDLIGTGSPLLLIEPTVEPGPGNEPLDRDGCTLYLPMGDPENLGAALRSAAAFEVGRVVLLSEAAHPYHPRALRAAAGATPRLFLERGPALTDLPGKTSEPLFLLDAGGEDIRNIDFPQRFGLLAGPEGGPGEINVNKGGEIRKVSIPAADNVESLNTTVALSIALFLIRNRGTATDG